MIKYARSDRAYTVTFPNLPGCVTFGDTLDEAKRMAAEALSGYLASIFERNVRMPKPSKPKRKNAYPIRPETPDRKSTRLNSSHIQKSRMPSSA